MSMKWEQPDIPAKEIIDPPPLWGYVVLYVMIELAAVALTVANWPKGQPTMTGDFWIGILVLPFLFWLGLSCMFYSRGYEEDRDSAQWWNHLREFRFSQWRNWTHAHMALIDSVVLTPEDELAERMLGLEGSMPANPDKVLLLPVEDGQGAGRMEQVLEQLLTSLTESIKRFGHAGKLDIVLQTGSEVHKVELEGIWRNLDLPTAPTLVWLPFDAEPPLVEQWFAAHAMPDYRLVLACQLHDGTEAPSFSESAVALLLTTPTVVALSKKTIRPQACLLRPIVAESDTVNAALATLLYAEQAPLKKIKHFWHSRLSKLARHATAVAVKDANLSVTAHDLDRAMGKPGPITGWLLQALAAQMVQHGQGAQLVASPYRNGLALNLVGPTPALVPFTEGNALPPVFSFAWAYAMLFFAMFCMVLYKVAPTLMTLDLMMWMIVALLSMIVVQLVATIFYRRHTARLVHESFY